LRIGAAVEFPRDRILGVRGCAGCRPHNLRRQLSDIDGASHRLDTRDSTRFVRFWSMCVFPEIR
jgi:hypothetical protein